MRCAGVHAQFCLFGATRGSGHPSLAQDQAGAPADELRCREDGECRHPEGVIVRDIQVSEPNFVTPTRLST